MKLLLKHRNLILQGIDLCLWMLGAAAAMYLSGEMVFWRIQVFVVVVAVHIVVYQFLGMYRVIWRYAGIQQFITCIMCEILSYVLLCIGAAVFFQWRIGRFCMVGCLCTAMIVVCSRLAYVSLISWIRGGIRPVAQDGVRTLIIGAGAAARILLSDMRQDERHTYAPVGLVDDDPAKQGRKLWNVKVYGPIDELKRFVKQLDVELIVFAIFGIGEERKRTIMELCAAAGVKVMMAPNPRELCEVGDGVSQRLRSVGVHDLLGREPVLLDKTEIQSFIKGHRVLVTGAGGSIGSELCRQIAAMEPDELVLLDVYENGVYDIQQELEWQYGDRLNLSVEILSVCDRVQMERVFREYRPELLFHAAAHKHVPLMEKSPEEAIKNNIFGTLTTARMADKYGVKRFVMISSDKAVRPANIMGATKRCCEMIIQAMDRRSATEYVAVRFGNVLASNGSVIPLFSKQIEQGGPVTVTDPNITRYFMTIPEAVWLVLTAGSLAAGGEIFVLDMGRPVKILDLANNMIRLAGLTPGKDIDIIFTGLRPGEKLFEELLLNEEGTRKTSHEKIFVAAPLNMDETEFWEGLDHLHTAVRWGNQTAALRQLRTLVPIYCRTEDPDRTDHNGARLTEQTAAEA